MTVNASRKEPRSARRDADLKGVAVVVPNAKNGPCPSDLSCNGAVCRLNSSTCVDVLLHCAVATGFGVAVGVHERFIGRACIYQLGRLCHSGVASIELIAGASNVWSGRRLVVNHDFKRRGDVNPIVVEYCSGSVKTWGACTTDDNEVSTGDYPYEERPLYPASRESMAGLEGAARTESLNKRPMMRRNDTILYAGEAMFCKQIQRNTKDRAPAMIDSRI